MQTRKNKRSSSQSGGLVLGKGNKGTVLTVGCGTGKSLCSILQSALEAHQTLYAYTPNMKKYRLLTKSAQQLLDSIQSRYDLVVKQFRGDKKHFMNELKGISSLWKIGEAFFQKNTAYTSLSLQGKNFVAFQIADAFYVLNRRCYVTVLDIVKTIDSIECKQMIRSILGTLVQFQKHGLYHNDIKMDNIMKCIDRYKLIDMERMLDFETMKKMYLNPTMYSHLDKPFASVYATSPIAQYIFKKTLMSKKQAFKLYWYSYTLIHKYQYTLASFEEFYEFFQKKVIEPTSQFLQQNQDLHNEDLFERFVNHFDTYSVGILIAQLYFIQDGRLSKRLLDFAECLLNPAHPHFVSSAQQALKLARVMFDV